MTEERAHWTLDRRIPIFALGGLIAQTIVIIVLGAIWMTRIDNTLSQHGERITSAEERLSAQSAAQSSLLVAVARLEEQGKANSASLVRIEAALTRR